MSSAGTRGKSYLRQLGKRFLMVGLLFVFTAPAIIYLATRMEQERRLDATTREIARMLARDLRYPLLVSSKVDAFKHIEQILRLPDVIAVEVRDEGGRLLASAAADDSSTVRRRSQTRAAIFSEQHARVFNVEPTASASAGMRLGTVIVTVSRDRVHQASEAIAFQAALGLLVLTAVLALSTLLLSVRLFRPLSLLAGFLEAPSSVEAPLPHVGEGHVAEAQVIHSAVGVMRARLAEDQRLLRRYAEELETMVEARTRELVAARDQAERANHAKTLFLANVSHELRTPLQAITVLADMESTAADSAEAPVRGGILTAATQLLDLIEQLLVLSRAESGVSVECMREPLLVNRVVAEAIRTIEPTLNPGNSISMAIRGSGSSAICSDPTRIRQVLNNLVRNADRYMQNGRICIEIDTHDRRDVVISVRDEGIGIAEIDLARIFEPFYQGTVAPDGVSPGGVGLGLWLSRHIVEALGGRIEAENALGGGCIFRFHLPRETPASDGPRRPKRNRSSVHQQLVRNPGARILLAEDEALIRLPLTTLLREAGFTVVEVADGDEARRRLGSSAKGYEAIVIDHWLPGAHGLELLRSLDKKGGRLTTPTIVFTADETPALRAQVEALGAFLMIKPVIASELVAQIDAAIDGATSR
jgi:signal transduction histidine kinase